MSSAAEPPFGSAPCFAWAPLLVTLLAANGNNIRIVIYTNDDKGTYDPEMNSEHLASKRMQRMT
jgi:hypothetical protein